MNEALQRWRDDFAREPDAALDRLVCGRVALGAATQLSFGEILDTFFEPGDLALDASVARWLSTHILGRLPDGMPIHRWVFALDEFFRGIGAMELAQTGDILRREHARLCLWLRGFYEGPDRDPEGAYLLALARSQDDQRFSSLWRRLILGEKLADRPYISIGVLGFRKMPGHGDVPEGLLQAVVDLAEKPAFGRDNWRQLVRSLFATYRRSESYWIERFAPLLPSYEKTSLAREWLSSSGMLPGLVRYRRPQTDVSLGRRVQQVPVRISQEWAAKLKRNPALYDTVEFAAFCEEHRAYARETGIPNFLYKSFNNIAKALVRSEQNRAQAAVSLMEEALHWAPFEPRNWTTYAATLDANGQTANALNALWEARQRFPWNPVIRNELGKMLRDNGDPEAAEGVFRETVSLFPNNPIARTGLGETLTVMERLDDALAVFQQAAEEFVDDPIFRASLAKTLGKMGRVSDARQVLANACTEFPRNAACKTGLADLLVQYGELEAARPLYAEVLNGDPRNLFARSGLAKLTYLESVRTRSESLRDDAKRMLEQLANEGVEFAQFLLETFKVRWNQAVARGDFRVEPEIVSPSRKGRPHPPLAISDMSVAERLGRAMIALWRIEHAEDPAIKSSLSARVTDLLDVADTDAGELLSGFIETRGLVFLATSDARVALTFFDDQIRHYGRGGWIGIRLGAQRARLLLGEHGDAEDEGDAPDSQSARFALQVARVIQSLASAASESAVLQLLKALYPKAAGFAAQVQRDATTGEPSIESGPQMLGTFLQARWFRPAGIESAESIDSADALHAVVECIRNTRSETLYALQNATLAPAA